MEASPAEVLASQVVASSGLLGLLSSTVAATQASLKSGSPNSGGVTAGGTQQSAASAVRPFLISSIMGLREPPNGKYSIVGNLAQTF